MTNDDIHQISDYTFTEYNIHHNWCGLTWSGDDYFNRVFKKTNSLILNKMAKITCEWSDKFKEFENEKAPHKFHASFSCVFFLLKFCEIGLSRMRTFPTHQKIERWAILVNKFEFLINWIKMNDIFIEEIYFNIWQLVHFLTFEFNSLQIMV